MSRLKPILIAGLALLPAGAHGETFAQQARRIGAEAPQLTADSLSAGATLEAMKADLRPEGPELEGEYLFNGTPDGENRWSVGISQEFLWPGAYNRGGKLQDATGRMLEAQAKESRLNMTTEAECRLIALASALTRAEIQREIAVNMDSLLTHYTRAFHSGEATILDVNKLRIERAKIADSYRRTLGEINQERAALQAMAPESTLPDDNTLKHLFITPLPATPSPSGNPTTSARARLAETEQAKEALSYARTSSLPGFSIGYAHSYEDGTHFNGLSLGIKLPSWGRGSKVKSSAAELLAAQFTEIAANAKENATRAELMRRIELQREALAELAPAVYGITSAQLKASEHPRPTEGDVLDPRANVQFTLLRKALAGGEISVLEYLTETNFILESINECVTLRTEILTNLALLQPLIN